MNKILLSLFLPLLLPVLALGQNRLKDKESAETPAEDDYLYLDGEDNGVRKLPNDYYAPRAATTTALNGKAVAGSIASLPSVALSLQPAEWPVFTASWSSNPTLTWAGSSTGNYGQVIEATVSSAPWTLTVPTCYRNGSSSTTTSVVISSSGRYRLVFWTPDGTNLYLEDNVPDGNFGPIVTVASATTTNIGAVSSSNVSISGTTTITGFGTAAEGLVRFGVFEGALTLTYNGTSLILPGGVTITTVAGDTFIARSLGSGNWRVLSYTRSSAPILQATWSFDPKAVCDGAVDRLFLMRVGANAPNGIVVTGWNASFEADPTTEVDLDLKRADAYIGVANAAVMDVLDTTAGVSSEGTASNINSGAAVANGKVMYLEFGTAYTEANHQIIFELFYRIVP